MIQAQKQELFKKIISMIDDDTVRGFIWGSTVHQMLSGMKYDPRDLDILFSNHDAMRRFNIMVTNTFGAESDYTVKLYQNHGYNYTFTSNIRNVDENDSMRMTISHKNVYASRVHIHCCVLDINEKFSNLERTVIYRRDITTAELLTTKIARQNFLANFYFNGTIYHELDDLVNVDIPMLVMTKKMTNIIRKYMHRGMKVHLIDVSKIIAPTQQALTLAKDNYRSMGLTVIPLSRNDQDMAGKCPSIANWTSLSNAYNFNVGPSCANIGIVCGPSSGIICIDVDLKDRGVEMFNKMVALYGPLPNNVAIQRTGNGGYHYIFKYDHTRMSKMMAKIKCPKLNETRIGIDMWIQQCQFVTSPSINYTNNRQYIWTHPIKSVEALPMLPEWIYELYHTEQINETGIILATQSASKQIEAPTKEIQVDTHTIESDSESDCEMDCNEGDSISSEVSDYHEYYGKQYDEPETSETSSYEKYFNVDMNNWFEQMQYYKQMLMVNPEYLIGLFILLVLLMAMIGLMILIAIIVAIIYYKKIQQYITEHFKSFTTPTTEQ
jgi:Bifunctional DNA primase/polymerase, N-terminal